MWEDNIMLLLPLATEGIYAFFQPYVNPRTDLTEYAFKIASIKNLELSDNENIFIKYHLLFITVKLLEERKEKKKSKECWSKNWVLESY